MRKIIKKLIITVLAASLFTGCSSGSQYNFSKKYSHSMNEKKQGETQTEEIEISPKAKEDYLIVAINSADETMRVYRYENGLEYQYYYGLSTRFLNKYGDYTSVAKFEVGDIINISETDLAGRVTEIRKADDVWIYEDVSNYTIDSEDKILEIAGTRYSINSDTYIFSAGQQIGIDEILEQDKISVTGIDKNILSISVTTGHGVLELANTQLFENSYLQLNRNIFVKITENMTMNVPEGSYNLVVANNGWGGSCEIEILRGQTTVVDLDQIKGEGPKMGEILFVVDAPDAKVYVDDTLIDTSAPIQLTYGAHAFEIKAEGYDKWKKTLYVNSPEATIEVALDDESKSNSSSNSDSGENSSSNSNGNTDSNGSTNGNSNGNSNGSANGNSNSSESNNSNGNTNSNNGNSNNGNSNGNNSSGSGNNSNSISADQLNDYLSTLSTLLDSL